METIGRNDVQIRIATLFDIGQIKDLDDRCFGEFKGVSLEEIENIINNGAIFLLLMEGNLVGESQIVIKHFVGCPDFPDDCAYLYGTAIHPDCQGLGLGKLLADEQEKFAIEANKSKLYFTIRVENYPSLKMRIDTGSLIIGYNPTYYGKNPATDSRLILSKVLNKETSKAKFKSGESDGQFVPVVFNEDSYSEETHEKIKKLIDDSFVGYHIDKNGIWFKQKILTLL